MKKQTAVDSLIEQLLPFIDRSKISDTALQNIVEEHLAMEKEQIIETLYSGKYNSYKAICSGCNKPKPTVNRDMFDGMCTDCTDKALYDYDFAKRAEIRNQELKGHCC